MSAEAGPSSPLMAQNGAGEDANSLAQPVQELHLGDDDAADVSANGAPSHSNGAHPPSEARDEEDEAPRAASLEKAMSHAGSSANGVEMQAQGSTTSARVTMDEDMDASQLRLELERTRQERDSYEAQYKGLLTKLGQMRSTLGDRLRQDAEELDRREQQIETLTTRVDELEGTTETLKAELVGSHEDIERLSKELDAARSLHQQQTDTASSDRKGTEARLREMQEVAERYRIDAEGWESACMEERARRDDIDLEIREAKRERDEAKAREAEQAELAAREQETARELQQVLEEFQAAQESDLHRALGEHEEKLASMSASLEEHVARAAAAEATADEYKGAAERCQALEKDVREKNLLVGKLRHEAVILNEHLTESLRRLRANTSDSSVDGKLITNLLIQFLNTPRQDTKRFEMLSLIASVLHWSDEDRERAGLQRASDSASAASGRKVGVSATASGRQGHKRQSAVTAGSPTSPSGGEESFSNLFVEFLLSEAEQAKKPQPQPTASGPASPRNSLPGSPQTTIGRSGSNPTHTPDSPTATHTRPSFNLGRLASIGRATPSSDADKAKSP